MAHKRAATDIKPKRTKVHDEIEILNDDVLHNIFSQLPGNTLMRFRCVSMHFNASISRFLNKLMSHTNIKPKRIKMDIPDDILCRILSRLPPNPLMRFRCVSMHWNNLISDPYFINSRSRPKILLSGPNLYSHLHALDNKPHSMTTITFPIKNRRKRRCIIALGTFNGIVVLVRLDMHMRATHKLVLYNPLTGATKKLPDPPYPCCNLPIGDGFGFGYGDDLKIIIAHSDYCCSRSIRNYCDVFSLKEGSWTRRYISFRDNFLRHTVGVFLNGFLHWVSWCKTKRKIMALDVKKMVVSSIDVPAHIDRYLSFGLGTLHKCLCMIEQIHNGCNVWVMKEHGVSNSWLKEYSFEFTLEYDYKKLQTLCILEDGRIVVMDGPYRIVFCDTSKGSYDVLTNTDETLLNGKGIEYVESMASPSEFCNV